MPFDGINPQSVVIMGNTSIHHVYTSNMQFIESAQARVFFLPPYSPDLNPLESVFGKVKTILKEHDSIFQTSDSPRVLIAMTFRMIAQEDCFNFTRHCGYSHSMSIYA